MLYIKSTGMTSRTECKYFFILGSNWWPWGEVKGQISLNYGNHADFKDFYTKLFVCPHKLKIQNVSDGCFILPPGSCPRDGILGHWGRTGRFFLSNMSRGISNRRGWRAEQNASNIFVLGSNLWPWGEVKRSNIINMSISKILYQTLCVFSQIKDWKHIKPIFIPWPGSCPWWDLGCWGSRKL